jgi:hypothetical protein
VRTAVDVLWRGTPLFPKEPDSLKVAEDFGLEVPAPAEIERAAVVVERACRDFLQRHRGEHLTTGTARSVTHMRGWARLHVHLPEPQPVSVCFGRTALGVTDRQRHKIVWATVDGRDGCLLVFEGRGRNCPACHRSRRTRWKTIEAEANANYRGLLIYPVWYPDGSRGLVRVGRCACGAEFQTAVAGAGLRQTRCDKCRKQHRTRRRRTAR